MASDPAFQPRILVVDDEKNIRRTLRMVLADLGADLSDCGSSEEALRMLREDSYDMLVLDIKLPGMDGMELLGKLRKEWPDTEVIMISGHASIQDAIEATRLGAYDVLEKPLDRDRVILSVENCLEKVALHRQVRLLRNKIDSQFEILGSSSVMRQLLSEVDKVAPTNGRVLITGESGTGKELVARAVHKLSKRAEGSFVKVNCAAIPAELIESELFGYERGAFTGATSKKKGLFELASGGTLFLDEIGDMSLAAQAKVLRVLQTGELSHVGGERVIKVDVRVLAATNKELKTSVDRGEFREDLYFRLNVIPILCPPLRERLDDIPQLATRFAEEFCVENGFKSKSVEPEVLNRLKRYDWPGNVRELKNVIERMVIMSDDALLSDDVPEYISGSTQGLDVRSFEGMSLRQVREEVEREFIRTKLDEYGGNITRTAEALGIERTNLHKKIKQLGVKKED